MQTKLEPLKQPHFKMKMSFEQEKINPNKEKFLVKNTVYEI